MLPRSRVTCSSEEHDAIKADPARWAAETVNRRPLLTDDPQSLPIAECIHCNSTLTPDDDEELP